MCLIIDTDKIFYELVFLKAKFKLNMHEVTLNKI